jgi:hypothetical protein
MLSAISILFGAALAIAACWALGTILLRRLSLTLYRLEERCFAFIVGSACLSAIVFALAAARLAYKGVFLALGILIVGYALFTGAHRPRGDEFAPLSKAWKWVFGSVFGLFTFLYFFNAMAPEMSPDGMSYHLGEVLKYFHAHGFVRITSNMYSNLSQGIELLFWYAFAYGKHSAAALFHFAYLVCLALLMLCYGRRIGHPAVGVAGALFTYASPVVGQDGTVAYNDVAIAAILFTLFYLLQIWDGDKNAKLLVPVGILAGFSFAAKYTAFLAVPYALGFIVWKLWRDRKPVLRPVLSTSLLALLFILPWMVKNWVWVDNPVSPFANRLFPNRYMHISFEEDYRRALRIYGLTSYRQIPLQVTVQGDILSGFLGPLFLLTPLALLALRFRAGRQLWLAAVIFGLPYATNVGTRFLIPAVPFLSLALALAFANIGWLLLTLTLAHAFLSWPWVANAYCNSTAWRLNSIPIKAALRIEKEDAWLSRNAPFYSVARMIERTVPSGEKVFSFSQVADAYTTREIVVSFQAAENELLRDMMLIPLFADYQPNRLLTFRFAPRELRKIRLIQTEQAKDLSWSVFELRVLNAGGEVPRAREWRLTAHPNPWDVQLAFDNSPVTRWRSWQTAEPGMFVEVDFGRSQQVDAVVVEASDAAYQTKVKLDGMDAQGQWTTVLKEPVETIRRAPLNLRVAATAELKARGINYVLVGLDDVRSDDFRLHSSLWGMKCVGVSGTTRLYRIE